MKFALPMINRINIFKKKLYNFFFLFEVFNGIYILFSTLLQDLKNMIKFFWNLFKSFFIKNERILRWLELGFFLMFPFLHFFACAVFIYWFLFKNFFLICDIFILYVLMDIRNFLNYIVNYFIIQIPIWSNNPKYFKILSKKCPKIYEFIFNNKLIIFINLLISYYLIIKKYIFLIFFDSFFIYIPLLIKKIKYYIHRYYYNYFLWNMICAIQNKIDFYLYTKLIETEKKIPVWRYRFRKYMRKPGIAYRLTKYYWERNGIIFTSKLGWRRSWFIIRGFVPLRIHLCWIGFKIIVLEIYFIISYPFYSIYYCTYFYQCQIWYYQIKLYYYLYGFNVFLYPSFFKFFLVLTFYPIIYCTTNLCIIIKSIYRLIIFSIKNIWWFFIEKIIKNIWWFFIEKIIKKNNKKGQNKGQ